MFTDAEDEAETCREHYLMNVILAIYSYILFSGAEKVMRKL